MLKLIMPAGNSSLHRAHIASATRRAVIAGGLTSVASAAYADVAPICERQTEPLWGVNGHPLTAYPGITGEEQLDLVAGFGFSQYRFNTRGNGSPDGLEALLAIGRKRGITLLPILAPEIDLAKDEPAAIWSKSFELGRNVSARFKGRIPVWELGNEVENFAIIHPCEMRDDGSQYPCEWGPAGGVTPLEYYGPRWKKVSAMVAGLSAGVARGDPSAKRAVGTAGWGHLGAFERWKNDGVEWEITVWHDYQSVSQDYLKILAGYGKPIWITEFNSSLRQTKRGEDAIDITRRIDYYRDMARRYPIKAAFFYQLLDETYWGQTPETATGLMDLQRVNDGVWRIGERKKIGAAVAAALARCKGGKFQR